MVEGNASEGPFEVLFVIGLPGAGKGTLCTRLAKEAGWYHISVGDYLRELVASPTTVEGEMTGGLSMPELRVHVHEQKLIPGDKITTIVASKIDRERQNGVRRFLIDGFARNPESAAMFDRRVTKPSAVLLFDCPEEVAKARFVARRRGNDNGDLFDRRCEEYNQLNPRILAHYADKMVKVVSLFPHLEATLTIFSSLRTAKKMRRTADLL